MQPKTLSASAAQAFEMCEARYKAEYIDRVPDIDGVAGLKGSCVHAVLQMWVERGMHLKVFENVMEREKQMHVIFDICYYDFFADKDHYAECWGMVNRWLQRTDLIYGRTVISTEVKEQFDLQTSKGILKVTYIWDRCDELAEGGVEIVDYKTVALPVQPDDLKKRIQPRTYSLAARMKWKDLPEIWVSFDLLRYDIVGARFTRADDVETYKYLQALAEKIYASDGTKETLNPECRFCVRKHVCETLLKHEAGGGILGMDRDALSDHRAKLDYAIGALRTAIAEADEQLLTMAEEAKEIKWSTTDTEVTVKVSSRRGADSERVARIIGPELMARYGSVGVGNIDEILKGDELDAQQKQSLKALIRKNAGKPTIQTKPLTPFTED